MLILPFAFKGKILEIVKKEANNMLNAKLEFADLNLSFFSHFPKASIELQQLSLTGIGDFEKDTLVSAKEIDIAVNIMSLFGDKGIEINHIILEKPQVKAVKLANGNDKLGHNETRHNNDCCNRHDFVQLGLSLLN